MTIWKHNNYLILILREHHVLFSYSCNFMGNKCWIDEFPVNDIYDRACLGSKDKINMAEDVYDGDKLWIAVVKGIPWIIAQENVTFSLKNNRNVEGWCVENHLARKTGYIKLHKVRINLAKRTLQAKIGSDEEQNSWNEKLH